MIDVLSVLCHNRGHIDGLTGGGGNKSGRTDGCNITGRVSQLNLNLCYSSLGIPRGMSQL